MIDTSFDFDLWLQWRESLNIVLTILGFTTALSALFYKFNSKTNTSILTFIIMIVMLILLGFFPIEWGYSTDRANYANDFISLIYGRGDNTSYTQEYSFILLTKFLGSFLNVQQYFVAISFIYLTNYYIAIRRLVSKKSFWLAVGAIVSMGFTGYAINTMRAGLALSFLILGIAMYPSKWRMAICLLIGAHIHNSVCIPAIIAAICYRYSNTRFFYYLWFISIPVAFFAGNFFMHLFTGMSDDVRTGYLTDLDTTQYKAGFRIDFIAYSLAPIVIGGYYIFKKKFNDQLYKLIYNTYILTNIFWILVIRANYSDRFAYLSWVLIPFILIYPLLKQKLSLKENLWLSLIILGESIFRLLV